MFLLCYEQLNSIPNQVRTLRVNLALGKLYLHEGLKSKAEECYTVALRYYLMRSLHSRGLLLNAALLNLTKQAEPVRT